LIEPSWRFYISASSDDKEESDDHHHAQESFLENRRRLLNVQEKANTKNGFEGVRHPLGMAFIAAAFCFTALVCAAN